MTESKKTIQHLVVTILGGDKPGIANEICKLAAHCGCNISDCRITVFGNEFSANLQLSGTWNAIAKFEASLPGLEQKHELHCLSRRTQPRLPQPLILPYSIYL